MFGITFEGHPNLLPLLLPDGFEGNPLRKEFILAARVAKPWPGAKEPGESDHAPAGAPSRRRTLPPGVPDPETWGPRAPGSRPRPPGPRPSRATPARPRRAAGEAVPANKPSPHRTEHPLTPPGRSASGVTSALVQPLLPLTGEVGDQLEVLVGVENNQPGQLRRCRNHQIGNGRRPVLAR